MIRRRQRRAPAAAYLLARAPLIHAGITKCASQSVHAIAGVKRRFAWNSRLPPEPDVIAFLRNPADRAVSGYHFLVKISPRRLRIPAVIDSPEAMLRYIDTHGFFDVHVWPQIRWLDGLEPEYVYTVENGVRRALALHIDGPLADARKNTTDHPPPSAAVVDLANRIYARDLAAWSAAM